MRFPPLKPGRALLWIALHPDDTMMARCAALQMVLKTCHLHPLDTTSTAELVIVEEVAFRARLEDVRAALGPGDLLHLIVAMGDRLAVEAIAAAADSLVDVRRPPEQRPAWLRDEGN